MLRSLFARTPLHSAGNTTSYCYRNSSPFPSVNHLLGVSCIKEKYLPVPLIALFRVSCFYFCRISELLSVVSSDIVHPDRVVVKGLKGSRPYLIFLPLLSSSLGSLCTSPSPFKIFPFTYHYCYTWAKRVDWPQFSHYGKNNPVFHLSRFLFCQNNEGLFDSDTLSSLMRHRSNTSLSFYLKKRMA